MVPSGNHIEIRETIRTQSPFLIYYKGTGWGLGALKTAFAIVCCASPINAAYLNLSKIQGDRRKAALATAI